jgi:hypothetical protein
MKAVFAVAALVALAGCQKADDRAAGPGGFLHPFGRFGSVGLYAPGRMWRELRQAHAAADPATAVLRDDDTIIVTIDSRTGELRQCGNLSGYCIAMNPWAQPAASTGPAPLLKHAEQLEQEDAAAMRAGQAAAARPRSAARETAPAPTSP